MLDFIFITGTSGIGKSTLAKNLLNELKTVVIEQNMVPEFISRDGTEEMTGRLEELTCWENTKAMALCFHRLGYQNIIISDIDDLRTSDIPIDFKGYRYLTLKMVCSDLSQLQTQMKNRPANGLIDYELQEKCNSKNLTRQELVNEQRIDITGLPADDVLKKALLIINSTEPSIDYSYVKPAKEMFYSWVFDNGLR
ncbi:MAG: hypothetical protein IKM29_06430 [Clostridia bacterium]|nr:hypothetical protein [Clostridia bacterium]